MLNIRQLLSDHFKPNTVDSPAVSSPTLGGRPTLCISEAGLFGHRRRNAASCLRRLQRLHLCIRPNWSRKILHDDGKTGAWAAGHHPTGERLNWETSALRAGLKLHHLITCVITYLVAILLDYLHNCLLSYFSAHLLVYLPTDLLVYSIPCILAHSFAYLVKYLLICSYTYLYAHLFTYLLRYLLAHLLANLVIC